MPLPKELTTVTILSKTIAIALFIVLPILGFLFGIQFEKNNQPYNNPNTLVQVAPTSQPISPIVSNFPINTAPPTITDSTEIKPSSSVAQINGVEVNKIKYTIPTTWSSNISNNSLMLSPKNGGGFLAVKVYDYSGLAGRREFYCQITKFCIDGTTKFTVMTIGNISGYMATALDNSGGGSEYFGAKGNKFYIISIYNPPSPNDFEGNYQGVLNSLIF